MARPAWAFIILSSWAFIGCSGARAPVAGTVQVGTAAVASSGATPIASPAVRPDAPALNLPTQSERPKRIQRPDVVLPLVQTTTTPSGENRLLLVGFAPAKSLKALLDENGELRLTTLRDADGLQILAIDGDRLTIAQGTTNFVLSISDVLRPGSAVPALPLPPRCQDTSGERQDPPLAIEP